jgi:hypothetical protein
MVASRGDRAPAKRHRVWYPAGQSLPPERDSETIVRGQSPESSGSFPTRPDEPVGQVGPEVARDISDLARESQPSSPPDDDGLIPQNPPGQLVPIDDSGQNSPTSPPAEEETGNAPDDNASAPGTRPGASPGTNRPNENSGQGDSYRADGSGRIEEMDEKDSEKTGQADWLIPTLISVTVAAIGAFLYVGFIAVDYRARYLQILRERRGTTSRSFPSDRGNVSSFYGTSHK